MTEELSWYAVMTHPRAEETVERYLRRDGYETFYPHYSDWVTRGRFRSRLIKKPYLSRYLFVGLGPQHHQGYSPNLYPVNETVGVSTVVYSPGGVAFPLPQGVMTELMSRANRSGLIHSGRRRFAGEAGDRVVLGPEGSPYWNFICEIQAVDSTGRVMVLLESFGRMVPTLIRREDIEELRTKAGVIIPKGDPRMCKLA